MIDTEALRKKVIDLAIQGKLTQQLPEDGNAEDLYAQIQKDKAWLIKEGKIKKEKSIPGIADDEIPFDIPDNWIWVRLRDVCRKIVDGDHNPPAGTSDKTEYLMLSAQNINNDELVNLENARYLTESVFLEENKRTQLEEGDVLLTIVATLGRSCVYRGQLNACFQRSVCVITTMIIPEYLKRVFDSGYIQKTIEDNATGAAQPGFYLNKVEKLCIPLPPVSEQKRIVERLDDVVSQLNIIDSLQKQYESDCEILKGKIIDAGIRGKLTEQLPEDGNAEDLYAQIQAEKAKLIKEGKIKKEKPLPEISDDEIPFEIPDNWKWVHMGDVFEHNTGKALNNADKNGVKLEYITTSNMYWDHFELDNLKCMFFKKSEIEKCTITKGDLLICEGGDIGRSAIWTFDYDMRIQNHIHRLRGYCGIVHKYYYYIMRNYKDMGMIDGRGIGLQGFSSKRVHSLVVPLPPLEEQKRIVEKIQGILSAL